MCVRAQQVDSLTNHLEHFANGNGATCKQRLRGTADRSEQMRNVDSTKTLIAMPEAFRVTAG